MTRETDHRTPADMYAYHEARIEALQNALREKERQIEALEKTIDDFYQGSINKPDRFVSVEWISARCV